MDVRSSLVAGVGVGVEDIVGHRHIYVRSLLLVACRLFLGNVTIFVFVSNFDVRSSVFGGLVLGCLQASGFDVVVYTYVVYSCHGVDTGT